jgi:hypothetical protein
MKKSNAKRPLALQRETLRVLARMELTQAVRGGADTGVNGCVIRDSRAADCVIGESRGGNCVQGDVRR